MKTPAFIIEINTENTGGNVMIDFVTLSDGKILAISESEIAIYDNMAAFEEGKDKGYLTW
jgi:hypothetical protein